MKFKMWFMALISLLWAAVVQAQSPRPPAAGKYYYGTEINGVLCGYAEFELGPLLQGGQPQILLKETLINKFRALGQPIESRIILTFHLDQTMRRFFVHEFSLEQGPTRIEAKMRVEGGRAFVSGTGLTTEEAVPLPPNVVLANPLYYPHLLEDFGRRGLDAKTYPVFDGRDAKVQDIAYTNAGPETLRLGGREFKAVSLDVLNRTNGQKYKIWLDAESGILLQSRWENRFQYFAEASVVQAIQTGDMDSSLTVKTNRFIPDFRDLSFLKVRAAFQPSGCWITMDSLSVPGQRFTGTVKDNYVEGEFEIAHPKYAGAKALPFPPSDLGRNPALKEFLEVSDSIQSDDPVLIAKAREIAKDSRDSWEAVCRLSRWVGENIKGAIPGGGTARGTYDVRAGECGGHSFLLAAFCRAVGIPARVVWGCMYTPYGGGIFAQHGWNEVSMGEAGWIPVDATLKEFDFVDSGHIRLGLLQSTATGMNGRRVEILEHRTGPGKAGRLP